MKLRLIDLDPRMRPTKDGPHLTFRCPCQGPGTLFESEGIHPCGVGFHKHGWKNDTDDLNTITVDPSIKVIGGSAAHPSCGAHFHIVRGEIIPCTDWKPEWLSR